MHRISFDTFSSAGKSPVNCCRPKMLQKDVNHSDIVQEEIPKMLLDYQLKCERAHAFSFRNRRRVKERCVRMVSSLNVRVLNECRTKYRHRNWRCWSAAMIIQWGNCIQSLPRELRDEKKKLWKKCLCGTDCWHGGGVASWTPSVNDADKLREFTRTKQHHAAGWCEWATSQPPVY